MDMDLHKNKTKEPQYAFMFMGIIEHCAKVKDLFHRKNRIDKIIIAARDSN